MQRILLIGGNSRLGRSICAQPQFQGVSAARGSSADAGIIVDDYANLQADSMQGFETVINVTGLVSASAKELHRVNAALASDLALKAKQAGVQRFVQISSFSVFGEAEHIHSSSVTAPTSPYGISRLAGENMVAAHGGPGFSVMMARLPLLYGYGDSKLEQLVRLWLRVGILPVPKAPVYRSMMHYDLAALALLAAIAHDLKGPIMFADVMPFEYQQAALALSRRGNKRMRTLTLPASLASFAMLVPPVRRSLYSSSLLDPACNAAMQLELPSRLYSDLTLAGAQVTA